jgi:hypothetical protein
MMAQPERTPSDWFQDAERWFHEAHQACAWCQGFNRVYKTRRGSVCEYHCGTCDFYASHDEATGRHYMGPGHRRRSSSAPLTMYALD